MYDHHNLHFSAWSLDRKGSMVFPSTKSLIIHHNIFVCVYLKSFSFLKQQALFSLLYHSVGLYASYSNS